MVKFCLKVIVCSSVVTLQAGRSLVRSSTLTVGLLCLEVVQPFTLNVWNTFLNSTFYFLFFKPFLVHGTAIIGRIVFEKRPYKWRKNTSKLLHENGFVKLEWQTYKCIKMQQNYI